MEDKTLSEQAAEEILKRIVQFAPQMQTTKGIGDLAEAYALVTGKVSSRGTQLPAK